MSQTVIHKIACRITIVSQLMHVRSIHKIFGFSRKQNKKCTFIPDLVRQNVQVHVRVYMYMYMYMYVQLRAGV